MHDPTSGHIYALLIVMFGFIIANNVCDDDARWLTAYIQGVIVAVMVGALFLLFS
jgi:hypothetical protein